MPVAMVFVVKAGYWVAVEPFPILKMPEERFKIPGEVIWNPPSEKNAVWFYITN